MDPLSALGVASAVITFLDFSWGIVTGAKEIYKSPDGTIENNAHLRVVQHLEVVSRDLTTKFEENDINLQNRMKEVVRACQMESSTLIALLEKFEVRGKRNRFLYSLKKSWMIWKEREEVEKLKNRLQEYRSQIMLHLLTMLQDKHSKMEDDLAGIKNACNKLMVDYPKQIDIVRNDLINLIKEHIQSETKSTIEILASIRDMQAKRNAALIHTAKDDTCGWIFGHDAPRNRVNNSLSIAVNEESATRQFEYEKNTSEQRRAETSGEFLSWLRHGQNILHISGKAGSGKSTLMKFIASHERTHEELQKWAGEKTLVIADFYFWNPGTELQLSTDGLYRSLLFQVLSRCPELTEKAFPLEWKLAHEKLTGISETVYLLGATVSNLNPQKAFEDLMQKAQNSRYKLCFFIDGLDECDGNRLVHEQLAQRMKTWTEGGDVKLCTSSRPYQEFQDVLTFPGARRIHLHLLNRFDIWTYCINRFSDDREARKTKRSYLEIINEIVENSEGVFLWAHLVVDIILIALRQGDPYHVLRKKLAEIPKELDTLYTKLREAIEKSDIDKERSNKMLLLAIRNPLGEDLNAIVFSWLDGMGTSGNDLENLDFPNVGDCHPYSAEEYTESLQNVEKKIDSLTRGFLELDPAPRMDMCGLVQPWFYTPVRFSHRTARDYFLQKKHMMAALEESFYDFEGSHAYGRLRLAEFIFGFKEISRHGYSLPTLVKWLAKLFPQHIDSKTCLKFQNEIQRLRPPLLFSLNAHYGAGQNCIFRVGYALADFELPPESETDHPGMLLTALGRQDWVYANNIVSSGTILDSPIRVETYGETVSSWPLWSIASIFAAHHQFSNHDYAESVNEISQVLRKNANEAAEAFLAEICWWSNDKEGQGGRLVVHLGVLVNVLKLAAQVQKLEKGEPVALIPAEDIGMSHNNENKALHDACMDNADFVLRSVWWKGQQIPFYSVSSRVLCSED
ncbi:hypothetical protein F4781DRAFT_110580 [Annulohypoxylon bovei var. microspora]|nr:hypothetical protein F4781DRAFT_110580 [Annulohypoxylon bovei var. microspora]